ncbi:MAG: hypothetical protein ACI4TT_02950 [Christensenellales bacterium]
MDSNHRPPPYTTLSLRSHFVGVQVHPDAKLCFEDSFNIEGRQKFILIILENIKI